MEINETRRSLECLHPSQQVSIFFSFTVASIVPHISYLSNIQMLNFPVSQLVNLTHNNVLSCNSLFLSLKHLFCCLGGNCAFITCLGNCAHSEMTEVEKNSTSCVPLCSFKGAS